MPAFGRLVAVGIEEDAAHLGICSAGRPVEREHPSTLHRLGDSGVWREGHRVLPVLGHSGDNRTATA